MSSYRWAHKLKETAGVAGKKVASTASNVKDDITRKKHATKDTEFSDIQKQFDEQNNLITQLTSDATAFIGGSDAILKSQIQMATDLLKVAPANSTMAALCQIQLDTYTKMYDNKVEMFDKQLSSTFTDPINLYLGQFREVSDRIRERSRRETEMDKLATERDKFQEKGDPRLAGTETKLDAAINAYSELNEELKKDIPKLLNQAQAFFEPLVVMFLINQANFWETMTNFTSELMAKNPDIRLHATGPQIIQVITPKTASAVGKKYSTTASNNPWEKSTNQPPALTYNASPAPAIEMNPYGAQGYQPGPPPPVPSSHSFPAHGAQPTPPPPSAHPFPSPHTAAPPPGAHPFPPPSSNPFPSYGAQPTPPPGAHPFPSPHAAVPPPGAHPFPSPHAAVPTPGAQRPVPTPGAGANPFAQPSANPFVAVPPRPVPPPAPTFPQARALWDFAGQNNTELTFVKGDIITVFEKQGDWWNGELRGKKGLFPSNYVELT